MVQRTIRKKVKVPLYGQPAGKVAKIEDGATMGATIGSTLYFEDGSIVTLANLAAALGVGSSSSSGGALPLSRTLWRLIQEVPIYTTGTTSPTWEYTLDGAPIGNVGFAAAADGLASNTLAGDLVLAPVDGRVFIPVTSGNTALFIDGDVGSASVPLIMLDNTGAAVDRRLLRIRETDTLDRGFNLDGILSGDNADNALSWGSDFTGSIARALKFWADGRVGFANEAFLFDPADGADVSLTIAGGSSDAHLLVSSNLDVVLELRADVDNTGSENHNPYVLFSQDAAGVLARVGLTGDANIDPSGASFTGCLANSLALHHPEPGGAIALGTENAVAFLINTTNENVFLTAARFTAATAIEIESTLPLLLFDETDAASDERQWRMRTSGGVFRLDTYTDAGVLGTGAIIIDRAGTTPSEIELNATLLDGNFTTFDVAAATIATITTPEANFEGSANSTHRLRLRNASNGASAQSQFDVFSNTNEGLSIFARGSGHSSGAIALLLSRGNYILGMGTNDVTRWQMAGDGSYILANASSHRFYSTGASITLTSGVNETPAVIVERTVKIVRTTDANLSFFAYNASLASPSYPTSGQTLGEVRWHGYNENISEFAHQAGMIASASQTWTSSVRGTSLSLRATDTGSTSMQIVMTILPAMVNLPLTSQFVMNSATANTTFASSGRPIIKLNATSTGIGGLIAFSDLDTDQSYIFGNTGELRVATLLARPITFYTTNAECGRFSNSGAMQVYGQFGSGFASVQALEFGVNAGNCYVQSYNRGSSVYTPLVLSGNGINLQFNGGGVLALSLGANDSGGAGFRVVRVPN